MGDLFDRIYCLNNYKPVSRLSEKGLVKAGIKKEEGKGKEKREGEGGLPSPGPYHLASLSVSSSLSSIHSQGLYMG